MGSPLRTADALRRAARQAADRYAPKPPPDAADIACRAGCSFCCRSPLIEVAVPEALTLAETIKAMPEPQRAATIARVRDADDRSRGLTMAQRLQARIACPLLQDDRCSVYDARPLSCRAAVSLDAAACERSFAGTPTPIPMPRAYWEALGASVNALGQAFAAHGMPLRSYEFNAALRIALEMDDAAARWAAGEDIFAPAQATR
jgi:hypothetical protein